MAKRSSPSVYDEVVAVTHVYLGPAADRFIARQIENHLHKAPAQLTREDLFSMLDWIRNVVALLSDDTEVIEEFVGELYKLTGAKPPFEEET